MRIIVEIAGVGGRQPRAFAALCSELLKLIVEVNRAYIRQGLVPPLYASGVVYREESADADSFADALSVYRRGYGDCAHLAAWRVAELQVAGEDAKLRIKWAPQPDDERPRAFHAEVRRADGSTEDPSKALGMPGRYS